MVYEIANFFLGEAYNIALTLYADDIVKHLDADIGDEAIQIKADIARLEGQTRKCQSEIDNFNHAIATEVTGEALKNFVNLIEKRLLDIRQLKKELSELREKVSLQSLKKDDLIASFSLKNLVKFYDESTTQKEKRELLKPVISKAEVHKDTINIETVAGFKIEYNYHAALGDHRARKLVPSFVEYVNGNNLKSLPEKTIIKKWREYCLASMQDFELGKKTAYFPCLNRFP